MLACSYKGSSLTGGGRLQSRAVRRTHVFGASDREWDSWRCFHIVKERGRNSLGKHLHFAWGWCLGVCVCVCVCVRVCAGLKSVSVFGSMFFWLNRDKGILQMLNIYFYDKQQFNYSELFWMITLLCEVMIHPSTLKLQTTATTTIVNLDHHLRQYVT